MYDISDNRATQWRGVLGIQGDSCAKTHETPGFRIKRNFTPGVRQGRMDLESHRMEAVKDFL